MIHMTTHPKRYPLVLMPQPQSRFNSLKASHSHFQSNLTKRHSLDSRPPQHTQKQSCLIENAEDYHQVVKQWDSKVYISKGHKSPHSDNNRLKYFWRHKHGKSSKKEEKTKMKKVKRNWSELGKQFSKKDKLKYSSKSKYQDISKINNSDRLETKNEITNGKSNESYHAKRQPFSGQRTKIAKSLLNSTMLTKRLSEQPKRKSQNKYQQVILKLKDILCKYQRKVKLLKEQKELYKLKLKKERRKKIEF